MDNLGKFDILHTCIGPYLLIQMQQGRLNYLYMAHKAPHFQAIPLVLCLKCRYNTHH